MFIDYYSLLDIEETASIEEIRKAFRIQANKWHPDRNIGKDTNRQMQLLNEAYLILKDSEARSRYDKEYLRFTNFQREKNQSDTQKHNTHKKSDDSPRPNSTKSNSKDSNIPNDQKFEHNDYSIIDETLKRWIANAKRQAYEMAKETVKEFGNIASVGIKEGVKGAGRGLIVQFIIGFIILLIFGLSKSCN